MIHSRGATKEVLAMGQMDLTGNIIPHNWYGNLKRESGKTHSTSIILLAEIVYWYRPTIIRDESTGQVVEVRRKFKADKLQRSYDSFAEQFGFTKRQVKDALKFLESKGIINLDFRHFRADSGMPLSNVLFIGINPGAIAEITHQHNPSNEKTLDGLHSNVTHPPLECKTYTETTTETTTETKDFDPDGSSVCPDCHKPLSTSEKTLRLKDVCACKGEQVLNATFGDNGPADPVSPTESWRERLAEHPWLDWSDGKFTVRPNASVEAQERVAWILERVTTKRPREGEWKLWSSECAKIYEAGDGDWDSIERGIKSAWKRKPQYRPRKITGFADEVENVRADRMQKVALPVRVDQNIMRRLPTA